MKHNIHVITNILILKLSMYDMYILDKFSYYLHKILEEIDILKDSGIY